MHGKDKYRWMERVNKPKWDKKTDLDVKSQN